MIIADRTFSNLEILAKRKFFNKVAKYLFKIGSWGWSVKNEFDFV